jgi:hypothetical protein
MPLASARVTINAGNPTTLPGDIMNLALAGVSGYVVNNTGVGAGNVTSDNLQTLNWTGIESANTDDTAPSIVSQDFFYDVPQQTLDVVFSEDVSASLSNYSLSLTNLTTAETIAPANIALNYDAGTNTAHFTFPGYANGVLPDGNYQAVFSAGTYADAFGNVAVADSTADFFFLTADANHDGSVDTVDFNTLAANFGQSGTFSQGDFNYDGTVDTTDFNLLASRFGQTLIAPAGASPTPGVGRADPLSRRAAWEMVDIV